MRHAAAGRRSRHRNNGHRRGGHGSGNGGNYGNNRNQIFDSNGPEVRIRGTAYQICEKYMALAKDSAASGDRVLAESYLQHAEHYQRIISSWQEQDAPFRSTDNNQQQQQQSAEFVRQGQEEAADDLGLPASIVAAPVRQQQQELETA